MGRGGRRKRERWIDGQVERERESKMDREREKEREERKRERHTQKEERSLKKVKKGTFCLVAEGTLRVL